MESNNPYQLLFGIIFFILLSVLISYLLTTFIFPIGIVEVYGVLMLGLSFTVFIREVIKAKSQKAN
jgi:hypothetical protein